MSQWQYINEKRLIIGGAYNGNRIDEWRQNMEDIFVLSRLFHAYNAAWSILSEKVNNGNQPSYSASS